MENTAKPALAVPPSLFLYALVYGGMAVLAGVLGAKLADVGTWPLIGRMTVESGIFAFLLLIVLSSAVSELHGVAVAQRMVRFGFVPLILSMILIRTVIDLVPPAPIWANQSQFALILGQGARMQFAGLCSYGLSQTLNVTVFARLAGHGMGRVLFVLHLRLMPYLREVIVPGLAPYVIAALMAWPVTQLVNMVNRWQGAGVLLLAGILYLAGAVAVLNRWVLTEDEKQRGLGWYRRSLGMLRGREVTA